MTYSWQQPNSIASFGDTSTPMTPDAGVSNGGVQGAAPSSAQYGQAINTATQQQAGYSEAANQQGTRAPGVVNPYAQQTQQQLGGVNQAQNQLERQLQGTAMNGQNSAAYQQYVQGIHQQLQAQTAQANSAGTGISSAGAKYQAQAHNAQTQAASNAGGTLVASQAQQAAQQQLGQTLGQQAGLQNQNYAMGSQEAIQRAQMQQAQTGINNQTQLGYNNLANQQGNLALAGLSGEADALNGNTSAAMGQGAADFAGTQAIAAGTIGAVGGLSGAIAGTVNPTSYGGGATSGWGSTSIAGQPSSGS